MYPCRKADGTYGRSTNIRLDLPLYSLQKIIGRRINVLKKDLDIILTTPGHVSIDVLKTNTTFPSIASIQVVLGWYRSLQSRLHCAASDPEQLWHVQSSYVFATQKNYNYNEL